MSLLSDLVRNSSTGCSSTAVTTLQGSIDTLTVQYSTVQYSTVQYSTVQHRTAQHSTAQHSTAQHSTAVLLSPQVNLDVFFV